jgi:hypothetical protein
MRTPALAIARGIWSAHRWGFVACMATLMGLAATYPLVFSMSREPAVVLLSILPLVGVYSWVLNALLVSGEPGSMVAGYPRAMLVLPVRTRTLVFWPMLYGSLGVVLLWLFTALLVYGPSGYSAPILLPCLALAALMAWIQALAWLPIPNHLLRLLVILVAVLALGILPYSLMVSELVSRAAIAGLLLGYIASAFALALLAVESQRRGEAWGFPRWLSRRARVAGPPARLRRNRPFRSPAGAQFWYEWDCHGWMLPGFTGFFVLLYAGLWLSAPRGVESLTLPLLLGAFLGLPIAFASAVGSGLGRLRPPWMKLRGSVMFVAIRPMTSGALVAAKFRVALASVLLTWAVTAVTLAVCVVVTGNASRSSEVIAGFLATEPGWRGPAILALALVLLPALTWKHLTDSVAPVIAGRKWVADGAGFVFAGVVLGLTAVTIWFVQHREYLPRLIGAIPWIVACAAVLKGTLAVAVFRSALRRRLMNWRAFWSIVGFWLALTVGAAGMAVLGLSAVSLPVSQLTLLVGIATYMPLVRYPLSTLALEWNRHR